MQFDKSTFLFNYKLYNYTQVCSLLKSKENLNFTLWSYALPFTPAFQQHIVVHVFYTKLLFP